MAWRKITHIVLPHESRIIASFFQTWRIPRRHVPKNDYPVYEALITSFTDGALIYKTVELATLSSQHERYSQNLRIYIERVAKYNLFHEKAPGFLRLAEEAIYSCYFRC